MNAPSPYFELIIPQEPTATIEPMHLFDLGNDSPMLGAILNYLDTLPKPI